METPQLPQEEFPPEPPREKRHVEMDPVAHKTYAALYFATKSNLRELEQMAREYDRASAACIPKAMPTNADTNTAPVEVDKSPAESPEALPSASSGTRLGEMFFFSN